MKSFLSKKGVHVDLVIDEDTTIGVTFYPVNVLRFAMLKDATKAVTSAINSLFRNPRMTKEVQRTQGVGDNTFVEISTEPVDADQIRKHREFESTTIQGLVETLLHQSNLKDFAKLLISSLRDDVPKDTSPEEFLDNTDPVVLAQMIRGFVEANKKVFADPLFGRIRAALTSLTAQIKLPGQKQDTPSETESPSGSAPEPSTETPTLKILG